jgi:predicted GH43/DUF377 family glycosyl hydrolase
VLNHLPSVASAHAEHSVVPVRRHRLRLEPDPCRVVAIPLNYGDAVLRERVERVLALDEATVPAALAAMFARFDDRHHNLHRTLEHRWREINGRVHIDGTALSVDRQLLVAAYLTMEYAIAAAAVANPSLTVAPDQTGAEPGQLRVVMSLRSIGEGHRSTIEFRTGTVDADGEVVLDPVGRRASIGEVSRPATDGSYTVRFDPATPLGERVLYAATPDESLGLEDARFVQLSLPGGGTRWAATYTGYDGRSITPKLLVTDDFTTFTARPLTGPGAQDKGVALFPRQVDGLWWAIGRQDGQRLFLMSSADLISWDTPRPLADPVQPWELVQIGNCGSPIETSAGWLVITHGVGLMRRYVLGAMLLDREDPGVVLGRLAMPLLEPNETEREGYVPNVVYSCGGVRHGDRLVLPYAYSDRTCAVASFDLDELLAAMR